jgi:demethylmenaquinone methyltransferase / 2-methoxy-6-polyprenyl-1,4-benzoquinol methylase
MPATYEHDQVVPFRLSDRPKKEQVAGMFDALAGRYDFLNHFLSGRSDIRWRKKTIRLLRKYHPQNLLDLATGTADMAILACKMNAAEEITGIDISPGMLNIGRQKIQKLGYQDKITLLEGDAATIKFAQNSFDAVMVAFGVRNFENLEKGLQEIKRVLRPGGRLFVLEFSRPPFKPVNFFYSLYMRRISPRIAGWFKQDKEAYQYLCQSIQAFPHRRSFVDILNKTGFTHTSFKPLSFGICCIYSGEKPS